MSSLLGSLPADWDVATLGEINTKKAPTLIPLDFAEETFEYYSIPDFQRDQRPSLTKGNKIKSSKLILEPSAVLFGKLNPRVEKVWLVGGKTQWRQIGSTEWITVSPEERVDRHFLYFVQLSPHVMPIAKTLVSGSTPSRQRVDPKSFYQLRVPIPPLPEQKQIAHVLSTVQRAIEAQERIIRTTTELQKALMQKFFTEGLRNESQQQTEVGAIPKSWKVVSVGDVTAVKGGKRLPKGEKLVTHNTGFPYIRVTDFNRFSVDLNGLLFLTPEAQRQISRYTIGRNEVFISIAGSTGIAGIIPPELDGANLTENAARLTVNDPSQLHPRFLMYWLASHHCQAEIKAQTVKNAQPKLALASVLSD